MNNKTVPLITLLGVLLLPAPTLSNSVFGQDNYSEDLASITSQITERTAAMAQSQTRLGQLQERLAMTEQEIVTIEQKQRDIRDMLGNQQLTEQYSRKTKNLTLLEIERRTVAFQSTLPTYRQLINRSNMAMALRDNDVNRLSRSLAYLHYLSRTQSSRLQELSNTLHHATLDGANTARITLDHAALEQQLTNRRIAHQETAQKIATLSQEIRVQTEKIQTLQNEKHHLTQPLTPSRIQSKATTTSLEKRQLHSPIAARIKHHFGELKDEDGSRWNGLLYDVHSRQTVRTSAAGIVKFAQQHKTLGMLIIIDHGNDLVTLYAHNDELQVKVGDLVTAQQTIAQTGDSVDGNPPSLYFELRKNGEPVDPQQWLNVTNH